MELHKVGRPFKPSKGWSPERFYAEDSVNEKEMMLFEMGIRHPIFHKTDAVKAAEGAPADTTKGGEG